MGIMSKLKKEVAVVTATQATAAIAIADTDKAMIMTATDDRERLRSIDAALAQGRSALAEIEDQLDRLIKIIRDADGAHDALQAAVADDNGVGLAKYAAGDASDGPMAKLIAAEETSAKAAAVAKTALPGVQAMLTAAKDQIARLEQERRSAVLAYLHSRAGAEASRCKRIFEDLCRSHDQLVGISVALAVEGTSADLLQSYLPLEIPRFARVDMSPVADPNAHYAPVRRSVSQYAMNQAIEKWRLARERLENDADAELDDLIGPTTGKED